jgi:hypothetical protein
MENWPFEDPPNVAVYTTVRVLEENLPILLVTHDAEDGAWQFLCGTTSDDKDGRIVGLDCIVERDSSVVELADLPLGWLAWRETVTSEWHRKENPRKE